MKLSAVIIAKNEEDMIHDCIESLSFCDEIVVIDSGSTDRTIEVAKRAGAKVYKSEEDNFAKWRNEGLEKTKGDWILYIDADERPSDELKKSIKESLQTEKYSAFEIKRRNYYLGNHPWPKIEKFIRLFNKKSLKKWKGELHESPIFEGEAGVLDGFLNHFTHRNLSYMLNKTIEWSKVEAKLRLDANHPKMTWWRFPRVMITEFINWYIKQEGWRLGTVGLIESMYQSFSMFITYARLWEMQKK